MTSSVTPSRKVICIDYSGSTGNNVNYWERVFKIALANEDAIFFFWDTYAKQMSPKDVLKYCQTAQGHGGTDPSCIAEILKKMTNVHLILITDGQIENNCVNKCDNILKDQSFDNVTVYFIDTGGRMNLSVSSPFTRNTKLVKIYVNDNCLVDNLALSDLDLNAYYDNPDKFINDSDKIFKHIVLTNLGKMNTNLRNDLLALQKNLINYLANRSTNADGFAIHRSALKLNDYDMAMYSIKKLLSYEDTGLGRKIELIIQQLINQCSNSTNFSFDLLQPGRLARALPVKTVLTETLPETENYSGFECPILIDNESIPILMINNQAPILADLEKNYLDALMTNPFLMLENNELMTKLINRFDHVISLSAFKLLIDHGHVSSPFTRNPITCLISTSTEKSHIKATNYALANLFFGKKLIGVPDLWLAVVYFAIKRSTYLKENTAFFESLTKSMMIRMQMHRTNMTLSGLPIEPLIKAPIDIAIWYCVVSPHLVDNEAGNRLRAFGWTAKYLIELVDLFGFPYNKAWTTKQMNIYRAFGWMMNEEKNNTNWRTRLRAQYQNSIEFDDGTIILLDGPAPEKKPSLPDFNLTLNELIFLSRLVDRQKTVNNISIPNELPKIDIPKFVVNYGYPANFTESRRPTAIDPDTYRPYIIDREKNEHWLVCAEATYGPINKQLSSFNYFCKYVFEFASYPTKEEFIKYMAERQRNRENPFDTLPYYTLDFVDTLFDDYEAVLGLGFSNVSPSSFIAKAYKKMTYKKNIDYYF